MWAEPGLQLFRYNSMLVRGGDDKWQTEVT
jgi:hypothetical protein